jgi:hypothetical protein
MFDIFDYLGRSEGFLPRPNDRFLPALEPLEDRAVPAVISVLNSLDLNRNGVPDFRERLAVNQSAAARQVVQPSAASTTTAAQAAVTLGPAVQASHQVTFDETSTNSTRTGALPKFDPNAGQLQSVQLIAEGSLASNVRLENLDAAAAPMKAELQGTIRFQVGNSILQSSPSRILEATLAGFDGQADLDGASSKDFGTTQLSGTFSSVTISNPAEVAAFIGTGSLSVSEEATATSSASGTGNLLALISTTVQGNVKVVYHYQPRITPPPQGDTSSVPGSGKFFVISRIDGVRPGR